MGAFIPFVFGHFDSGIGFNVQQVGVLTETPGQDPTNLSVETANVVAQPRLSPDGAWILWLQTGAIRAIRTDGTGETLVWADASGRDVQNPNWSVDGNTILFCLRPTSGTSPDIYTVPFTGGDESGNESVLYTDPSGKSIYDAFYTYNGAHVVFSRSNAVNAEIWSMDSDGTNAAHVATTAGLNGYSQLIPKYVLGKTHEWFAWNDNTTASPVWKRADVDGSNVVTLITFGANYRPPYYNSFAPDDSVLYYGRDFGREIWSVTNDGATHTLVYDNGTVAYRESAWTYAQAPDRVYAAENLVSGNYDIISVLPDGSDHRVEASSGAGHYTLV